VKKEKQEIKKLKDKLSKCIADKHIAKAQVKFAKHFLKNPSSKKR
tara:strand:- start:396 stop:530 length:135 start_codon:yes stop_codon:yes gene_type:complete